MKNDELNHDLLARYIPRPGRYALLPELTAHQRVALLCRVLYREGYNDHIAGHVTVKQDDGTYLANPWELTWGEVTASDILRLDQTGKVIEGEWNITPAINLHMDLHAARHDVEVVIHNHPRWAGVWSAAGRIPPVYDQTSALVDSDPVLYDEYRGTVEDTVLGRAVVTALGAQKWAMLANHGVLVVANGIRQAHLRAITPSGAAAWPGMSRHSVAARRFLPMSPSPLESAPMPTVSRFCGKPWHGKKSAATRLFWSN